jgi:hypothetical protein
MRIKNLDLYHKHGYDLAMSKKQQSRPRKRERALGSASPSEVEAPFLEKCEPSLYNRQIGAFPSEFRCEPEASPDQGQMRCQVYWAACSPALWGNTQ